MDLYSLWRVNSIFKQNIYHFVLSLTFAINLMQCDSCGSIWTCPPTKIWSGNWIAENHTKCYGRLYHRWIEWSATTDGSDCIVSCYWKSIKTAKSIQINSFYRNMVALNLGICLPKSCSQKDIDGLLGKIQNAIRWASKIKTISVATIPYTCQTADDLGWNFSAWDHVTL